MMNLTILVENFCGKMDLLAEYGFSVHFKCTNGESILMDTGQGTTLFSNAEKLDINLKKISNLVLSHGHFDHTWGVPDLLLKTGNIPVWAHPEFDKARYRKHQAEAFYIGSYIKKQDIDFRSIRNITEIVPEVWAVEVPMQKRDKDYVPVTNHLMELENNIWKPDSFEDDISLVVKGEHGYSIILGCAHAGVINILEEVSELLNTKEFYAVVGGMHIGGQSKIFCENVVDKLVKDYKVKVWRPSHCTGFQAASMLASRADNVEWGTVGTVLEL